MASRICQKGYSFIDHTADIGIEVHADDFTALLELAAEALFDIITNLSKVRREHHIRIDLPGQDKEQIMRNWLEELLYRFYSEDTVFSRFKLRSSDGDGFTGDAWGETFDPDRHDFRTEIKGITYHQFEVSLKAGKGWYARIVFDV